MADALLADGWVKGREEWGVRYPECVNSGYKSQVAADLDAHHWNGTVVRRYVTDWEERE